MDRNIIVIILGILFLLIGGQIGFPFEFLDVTYDRIAKIILLIILVATFYKLFKLAKNIVVKPLKWITVSILIIISLPYFFFIVFTTFFLTSNYYPMWQDLEIYSKPSGEKIIYQWRETSGSLYDYRNRKIFAENNLFRFSIDFPNNYMDGVWNVYEIKNDSTYSKNFNRIK